MIELLREFQIWLSGAHEAALWGGAFIGFMVMAIVMSNAGTEGNSGQQNLILLGGGAAIGSFVAIVVVQFLIAFTVPVVGAIISSFRKSIGYPFTSLVCGLFLAATPTHVIPANQQLGVMLFATYVTEGVSAVWCMIEYEGESFFSEEILPRLGFLLLFTVLLLMIYASIA